MTSEQIPAMFGLRGAKLPVRDITVTADWYSRVFGWMRMFEFPDEHGTVQGVGGPLPGHNQTGLAFRHNPAAIAQEGLELQIVIETRNDLQLWAEHLDRLGVAHSPIIDATVAWLVVLHDPDGHEIHLMTREEHDLDQTGRAGYGRRVPGLDSPAPQPISQPT
jgi:predicted enzyme related to lactoylglutathione lyase